MKQIEISSLVARYTILILAGIPNLFLFYKIFTPLTVYPTYFLFNAFFNVAIEGTTIYVQEVSIELVNSCIAASAYYLLFILNLATPHIKIKKRIQMLVISLVAFLLLNLIRIIILAFMALSNSSLFDITHQLTWYILSVGLVVGIWFGLVKIYKIKYIPFYSDMKYLFKQIKC